MQNLHDRLGVLQVNHLEIAPYDTGSDHFCRPAFFRLLVYVQRFLRAGATHRSVCSFKAAAQTGMARVAVAVAVVLYGAHEAWLVLGKA